MNPSLRRVALIAASLGLLVSLFVALRSDGDEEQDATSPPTTAERPARVRIVLRVQGGQPVGSSRRMKVERGREVMLVVISDVADHIHLHGYDLMADVAPGSPARIGFTADISGRFEVELEDRGVQIADLEVRP